jgi:methylated-DNA-[protein]-cysteine S-methyltransferase
MFTDYFDSPLGPVKIVADDEALVEVGLCGERGEMRPNEITMLARQWLREYFAGKAPVWTPPLRFRSAFSKQVSEAVMEIGFGEVAQVMRLNPYQIVVPCHRVVAKNGLGGYNGGVEIKTWLLEFERAHR